MYSHGLQKVLDYEIDHADELGSGSYGKIYSC